MKTKMILFFYAILVCFFIFGYLCPLVKSSSASDHLMESRQNESISVKHKHKCGSISTVACADEGLPWKVRRDDSAELSSAQQIKYGHGVGGNGGMGGGYAGGASGGSSGEVNGGAIPVYAAGAGKHHHNNYNGGNSVGSYPLFTAIIWAVLEVLINSAFYASN